jgi:hypothetical protein
VARTSFGRIASRSSGLGVLAHLLMHTRMSSGVVGLEGPEQHATADRGRTLTTALPPRRHDNEGSVPRSQDIDGVAREYSDALNREITYADISPEDWERDLKKLGLPEHLTKHLTTMAELNRYLQQGRQGLSLNSVRNNLIKTIREAVHAEGTPDRQSISHLAINPNTDSARLQKCIAGRSAIGGRLIIFQTVSPSNKNGDSRRYRTGTGPLADPPPAGMIRLSLNSAGSTEVFAVLLKVQSKKDGPVLACARPAPGARFGPMRTGSPRPGSLKSMRTRRRWLLGASAGPCITVFFRKANGMEVESEPLLWQGPSLIVQNKVFIPSKTPLWDTIWFTFHQRPRPTRLQKVGS